MVSYEVECNYTSNRTHRRKFKTKVGACQYAEKMFSHCEPGDSVAVIWSGYQTAGVLYYWVKQEEHHG